MPFIKCPCRDIQRKYEEKETSTTVTLPYVYKFGKY